MRSMFAMLFSAAAVLAGPAFAGQPDAGDTGPDAAFATDWEFYDKSEGPGPCSMTLTADGGVTAGADCAKVYPFLSTLAKWTTRGGSSVVLQEAHGGDIMSFLVIEAGKLEAVEDTRTYEMTAMAGAESAAEAPAPVAGQPAFIMGSDADALNGAYTFRDEASDKGCTLYLLMDGGTGQLSTNKAEDCDAQFPFLIALSTWEPEGTETIKLIGAEGSLLGSFDFTGDGFRGEIVSDGQDYVLERMEN
jgi:hypothetical protein